MNIYRPGQGVYARWAAVGAAIAVSAFGSWRLYDQLERDGSAAYWAGGVFLVLVLMAAAVMLGLWKARPVKAFNDLLIDTQAELAKVVWPTRQELINATTAVVITVVLLGLFLYGVDILLAGVVKDFIGIGS